MSDEYVWWHDATPGYLPEGYTISAGDFSTGWRYYVYLDGEDLGNFDSLEAAVDYVNSHIGQ